VNDTNVGAYMVGDATAPAVRFGHGASSFYGGAIPARGPIDFGTHIVLGYSK
jgi:hypothetical protein